MTSTTLTRTVRRAAALVISIAMQKGGTGKTTSVVNLARAAAVLGLTVLVVDLDPQGNATDALSVGHLPEDRISVADAITPADAVHPKERYTLKEVIVSTIWPGVSLAPVTNSDALLRAERLIQASDEVREKQLAKALDSVRNDYDLVLIDNGPSLGLLTANALAAAHKVLVVMRAERWSTTGLVRLRTAIRRAQEDTNPGLDWGGVLISRWKDTHEARSKLRDVAEHFPDAEVWASPEDLRRVVPEWISIAEAVNEGIGLDQSKHARLRVLHTDTYEWAVQRLMSEET